MINILSIDLSQLFYLLAFLLVLYQTLRFFQNSLYGISIIHSPIERGDFSNFSPDKQLFSIINIIDFDSASVGEKKMH